MRPWRRDPLLAKVDNRLRRLRFEPLEDRRVLAAVTVGNNLDVVNGDTSSIAGLIASDGGDGISLREAIEAANNTAGTDRVLFGEALSGRTILLGGTDLEITESLAIDASSLSAMVTIDAQRQSRVIEFRAGSGDLELLGLVIQNGETTGVGGGVFHRSGVLSLVGTSIRGNSAGGRGGGIYNRSGAVSLTESTVSGNTSDDQGGGVFSYSGAVTLTQSSVVGNESRLYGGGIHSIFGDVMVHSSLISDNSTYLLASGGGINAAHGSVTLNDSTVSRNVSGWLGGGVFASQGAVRIAGSSIHANRSHAGGAGIFSTSGPLDIVDSTVSDNQTFSLGPVLGVQVAHGGGIHSSASSVRIVGSTISGNVAKTNGGGLYARFAPITIIQSTIADNYSGGNGGGVYVPARSEFSATTDQTIRNSIVAGNKAAGSGPDLSLDPFSPLDMEYSLVGDTSGSGFEGSIDSSNVLDQSPLFGPLSLNGGPHVTHRLLPGSPAVDMGDPSFDPEDPDGDPATDDAMPTDQRGGLYGRVVNGRVDIGAIESQPGYADFDGDGDVDLGDLLAQQRGFGTPAPDALPADGDADDDMDVDAADAAAAQHALGAGSVVPLNADFDIDGDVDITDLLAQQRGFGTGAAWALPFEGDADRDRDVDADDQAAALNAFGEGSLPDESTLLPLAGEQPAAQALGLENVLLLDAGEAVLAEPIRRAVSVERPFDAIFSSLAVENPPLESGSEFLQVEESELRELADLSFDAWDEPGGIL